MRLPTIMTLFVLFPYSHGWRGDLIPGCPYQRDVCDLDPECIRKMREQRTQITACDGVHYGPSLLYEDRLDAKFWIGLDSWARTFYPHDVTYSVYSKTGPWDQPGSLKRVEGCCGMTLRDHCILPSRIKPGETHLVYLSLAKSELSPYCEFIIEESSGNFKFCNGEFDYGCADFVNGKIQIRHAYLPDSHEPYTPESDYCFFPAPTTYLMNSTGVVLNVEGITKSNNVAKFSNGRRRTCHIEKHVSGLSGISNGTKKKIYMRHHSLGAVCFFARVSQYSKKWIEKPVCMPREAWQAELF